MRTLIAALIVCLFVFPSRAQEEAQRETPKALLFLTINMPRNVPDKHGTFAEESIEACWEDAKAFVANGVPKSEPDATGVMAGCYEPKKKQEDL
jgi:hypothetical protein